MSLGIAIFASVVLVLLVYNAQFRKVFFWIAGSAVVLTGLVVLVLYLHHLYADRMEAKHQGSHQELVQACVERYDKSNYEDEFAKVGGVLDVQGTCERRPDMDWNKKDSDSQNARESDWKDVPNPHFIIVHGGETLRYVRPASLPQGLKNGLDFSRSVPLIYLGHQQEFTFLCGNFGEQGTNPVIKGTAVRCP